MQRIAIVVLAGLALATSSATKADDRGVNAAPYALSLDGGYRCANTPWSYHDWKLDDCMKTGRIAITATTSDFMFGLFNHWGFAARFDEKSSARDYGGPSYYSYDVKDVYRRSQGDFFAGQMWSWGSQGGRIGLTEGIRVSSSDDRHVDREFAGGVPVYSSTLEKRQYYIGPRLGLLARVPLGAGLAISTEVSMAALYGHGTTRRSYDDSSWYNLDWRWDERKGFHAGADASLGLSYVASSLRNVEFTLGIRGESSAAYLKDLRTNWSAGPFAKASIPFGGQ